MSDTTFGSRASLRASSSRASCATTSNRPASAADSSALASTASTSEKRLRHTLDELGHLHLCPSLGQAAPLLKNVRIYRLDAAEIEIDLLPIRAETVKRVAHQDVVFRLRVVVVEKNGRHSEAFLVPFEELQGPCLRLNSPATRDLLDIKWQDAAWVVREVNKLAEDGVGDIRSEVLPTGARVFFLVLPGIRVVVTFDRMASVVHVWAVWRSIRPVGR